MSNSAQGTISIKRVRSGKTLFLSFVSNGIPLMQVVDTDTGDVAPDWNQDANRPTLTPSCKLSTGETVPLSYPVWKYNGNVINFDGAESGGWKESHDNNFSINTTTGAIKVIKNLASAENYADDTLDYSATATVDGVEYTVEKSMTIDIHKGSSGTFTGSISLERDTIDSNDPTTTLTAKLTYGVTSTEYDKDYSVKWYKNDVEMSGQTAKALTVGRDMVDSVALFRADFYVDGKIVATAGKTITDSADTYTVKMTVTSDNKDVDKGKDVTVKAAVWNVTQEKAVELPSTATWSTKIYETDSWTVVGQSASDTITVTTEHTDNPDGDADNGGLRYIDIVTVTDSSTGKVQQCFRCKATHRSTSANKPGRASYASGDDDVWQEFNVMQPVYTPLLVADNAVMRFSQTNRLLITDTAGASVQGCLQGVSSADMTPLWMGGASPSEANFRVAYDGTLTATNANISGTVRASNLYHNVLIFRDSNTDNCYYFITANNNADRPDIAIGWYYTYGQLYGTADNPLDTDDITSLTCTGLADIILLADESYADPDAKGTRTVVLPRAEDFEGKIIEIVDLNRYGYQYARKITLGCIGQEEIGDNEHSNTFIKHIYANWTAGALTLDMTVGTRLRLLSVKVDGHFYWLVIDEAKNESIA